MKTSKAVNAEIRRLIEGHKPPDPAADLPDETSLPKQTPRAAIFELDANGVIGLAPPGPADRLADTEEVHDFYDDTRHKLESLIASGRNMLGPRLDDKAERFRCPVAGGNVRSNRTPRLVQRQYNAQHPRRARRGRALGFS